MISDAFSRFARWMERQSGRPGAFVTAFAVVLVWAVTGPLFHFSDTWQLVINTGTTIVTFLMVFIIQNAQNRDTQAIHLKLDELIRATHSARNGMIDLEEMSEAELAKVKSSFEKLAKAADCLDHRIDEKVERAVEREVDEELDERGLSDAKASR
ncbi:low affinity iron permease family protein [Azospirillum picis]|uniref:Low affinity Fe/Cu permease n=1 Tax=Azospirillum picis TaxID=488438 RepID=A0ABU0ML90_9PROT|nr:low affinity iron permease family protein [Azospirillum picis]MBP2300328.1 low affinity Fe/Cu permease [Azospirillum picis]MDQ0534124.1 low affinity Fe/Cu permease [Azospirillum picis]